MANTCTLQNILQDVLAVGNNEANSSYPPSIYSAHFATVTSFLITRMVELYPSNPTIVDVINPFIKISVQPVKDGYIELPEDYRNILGNPTINVNPDGKDCEQGNYQPINEANFNKKVLQAGCRKIDIVIVPKSEFADRTTSTYAFPTYNDPIGYFAAPNKIKVCPYDLAKVELTYVRKELIPNASYIIQPDDTYLLNPSSPDYVESEWENSAYSMVFKGVLALYSAYMRDPELKDWSQIIKNETIL